MKNSHFSKTLALVLFILPLVWTRYGDDINVVGLTDSDIDNIFSRADQTSRDGVLTGDELETALTEAVREIFKASSFYVDEEMIRAIVHEKLLPRVASESRKASFKDFLATVPSTVRNFRDSIFDRLLRAYDVLGLMEDEEIATEVYKSPDTFGLTYAAYRVLHFDFNEAATQSPSYTETRARYEPAVDRNIQEEINRITNNYNKEPVIGDEVIGGPGATGVDTYDEIARRISGKNIEIEETTTDTIEVGVLKGNLEEGLEGAYAKLEAKRKRKLNPSDL